MTMIKEIAGEMLGMFVGDARLALAIAATVAAAAIVRASGLDPLLSGGVLLAGSLLALVENVCRSVRR